MKLIELSQLAVITGETQKELHLHFTDTEDNNFYVYRATRANLEWLVGVLERRLKQTEAA